MSDPTTDQSAPTATAAPPQGDGYIPREVVVDDLGGMSLEDAIAATIVEFDDGDIVKGTVVKVDKEMRNNRLKII